MSVVVIVIVAVLVVGAVAVYLKDEKINAELRKVGIPGPPSWLPLIGHSLEFFMDPSGLPEKGHAEYGDVFTSKLLLAPTVHVSGKTLLKQVLVTDQKTLHAGWPASTRHLLGKNSVIAAPKEKHPSMRSAIQSSLTPQQLRSFAPDMARIVATEVNSWFEQGRRGPLDIAPEAPELALKVMAEMLLGERFAIQHYARMAELYHVLCLGLFTAPLNLPFTRFGKAMASRALLDDLFEREFRVHEAAMADDYASRPDIKNTLLAEFIRRGMTFEEISDNIATVMFAAHDTTASLMQLSLHYAAGGKGTFARIREELETHLGITPDTPEDQVLEAIVNVRKVPYIVSFVDEANRMQPIVAQVIRTVVSPIEIQGKVIPEGWNLCISLRNTTLTAPTFEEDSPLRFDAERFIKTPPDGLEYVPFGAGRRRCPGQEAAKLEVSMLIALVALKGDLAPAGDPLPAMWPVDPMPKATSGLEFDFMRIGAEKKKRSSTSRRSSKSSKRESATRVSRRASARQGSSRRSSSKRASSKRVGEIAA